MGPRRQQILVAALVLVLAVAGYRTWRQTSPEAVPSSNGRGRVGRTSDNAKQMPAAPDVHLDALQAERPQPHGHERDLFRFKPKAPPPAPPRPVQTNPQPIAPTQPSGPPPPPPITLKFLGFVTVPGRSKMAVLSDGMGEPIKGSEGDTILGRYKILKIGEESIEIAYLDGRGRTTIRMTGS
jgi:hypothetical protein